jgi:cellulose synthase/poly-beta-1,6-N-acetylglucosamine synthase-like glycosyltransferase
VDVFLWTFLGFVAVSIVFQGALTLNFVRALSMWRRPSLPDDECPLVTVVLCLRGGDPFLSDCLRAVLTLDYPQYELLAIVDHRDDPAWQQVEQIVAELGATNVRIQALEKPLPTCSLKCSSLLQAFDQLDESCEILAQLDADTIVHPTWLRELAGALSDPQVGAATGNRWYMPQCVTSATLVRCVWNAAAVVQMYLYRIAWGGTLAVKTAVLREAGLPERWSKAFCEDTMLHQMLKPLGLRVAFVPSLLMVNRESCQMSGFYRWCARQLLTARLYHPHWRMVALHGIFTTLLNVVGIVWLVAVLLSSQWLLAGGIVGGLAINHAANVALLVMLELAARRVIAGRGEAVNWLGWSGPWIAIWAVPLAQLVYAAALTSACFLRLVDWRGVSYRIGGPWQIELLEYEPYQEDSQASESQHSL